ncbi:CAP domain-containing protein [Brumimicrobium mesophilum]|uniref:CAP domain-containing protein n=1 Tax=Brumimicrobium mesophilum TaxID=392717 RepID=UPI000D13F16F|nr:CAP domain-containing protein [Brumimicrobium mesophilum]
MNLYLHIFLILIPLLSFGQLTAEHEEIINREVFNQMNALRHQKNLQPLKINSDLEIAAKLQADYNAKNKELSHFQSNNPQYRTPVKRVSMVKTGDDETFYTVGENATFTFITSDKEIDSNYLKKIADEIFESWKQSKGHRENMLNREFNHYGFATTVRKESGIIYAIQVFTKEQD